jgi:hypothetical protein
MHFGGLDDDLFEAFVSDASFSGSFTTLPEFSIKYPPTHNTKMLNSWTPFP